MSVIEEQINKLKSFVSNTDSILMDLARVNEYLILDLNTAQLEEKGIDSKGEEIVPKYRPLTISIKKAKGQPVNRVTLKDEGDFHNSFFVVYGENYFALGADDIKAKKLENKYGKDIYGLTLENIDELAEEIKPDFIKEFEKAVL